MFEKLSNGNKLLISIIIDLVGDSFYFVPIVGEVIDIPIAIIEGIWIYYAYKSKKLAIFGGIEEVIPFVDIIPTCTITHIYYYFKKDKSPK